MQVGTRFASLIQTASPVNSSISGLTLYQQSYDQVVQLLYNQVQAVIATGGNLTSFCNQDACDPSIKQMLNPPSGTDAATWQSQVENQVCLQQATDLISLLLPDQITVTNGLTTTTPGVILLLEQLQLPPCIETVLQNFFSWPASFFPNGVPAEIGVVINAALYCMQQALGSVINSQLKTELAKGLDLGLNMVVPPIYLTMWMVKGAFPAIFPSLMQALFTVYLNNPSAAFQKIAKSLDGTSSQNQTMIRVQLTNIVYGELQTYCKGLQFTDFGFTLPQFEALIAPMLYQIGLLFVSNNPSGKAVTDDECKKWLIEYAKPIDAGSNNTYGDLITDLVFKIGNLKVLGNQKFAEFISKEFLIGTVSKALTSALYNLRISEELILGGILNGLSTIMSTQAEVDDLLWGAPTPPVDMSSQLSTQLNQISYIVHQLLFMRLDQMSSKANWFTRYFKQSSAKALKDMLPSAAVQATAYSNVYTGMLGNETLNENLYFQVIRVMINTLKSSNNILALQT